MKIIANIDSDRVLCEVSVDELALLNGFSSKYDPGFKNAFSAKVGAECNLKKMVTTSKFVRGLRKNTLLTTKQSLEKALADIDDVIATASGLELFSTLADSEQID